MQITNTVKALVLAATLAFLAGCKVAVIVVEGGEVQSIASGTCLAGTVCIHEVTDTAYSESFTAVPDAGWVFVKWNNGGDFLCEDQTNPTCVLSNVGGAGDPIVEGIVASDKTFYIQPIFEQGLLPVATVIADDGNEWAELTQFSGVSYADVAAACPAGVCSGSLNGYDMTGFNWATPEQVRNLLNIYAVGNCGAVPCDWFEGGDWVGTALADGFSVTGTWEGLVTVSMVDAYANAPEATAYAGIATGVPQSCVAVGIAATNQCTGFGDHVVSGGWFIK